MVFIGLKFACSPEDESCDGQEFLSTSPLQLDQENATLLGMGFKTLVPFSNPASSAELSNIVIVRITY
jgi:hypothetical protein